MGEGGVLVIIYVEIWVVFVLVSEVVVRSGPTGVLEGSGEVLVVAKVVVDKFNI